ncbi:imidazolonepropionase [Candidatus Raskinella chloraquaticus]|uniref:Imidazolonepropionase n=1 Tax=Candidatus Raskinella chloraquaticus TaxID=1951219 RepID=A0A1W9HQ61_9HYPH|nr:MAG: imidazolonepropionase [Proteobacteria bacterium SG_bin8]
MTQNLALFTARRIATMEALDRPYGLIENGAIGVENGMIAYVGASDQIPARFATLPRHDFGNRLVTPALIDCHTHLIHGGNRAHEFEMRLKGATYEEVARAGGGILSTVRATRAATVDELVESALPRLDGLIAEGVSMVEIKSGYGLTIDSECTMLRAARRLSSLRPIDIRASYLAAHAVPPEYAGRADAYIDEVCIPGLRVAHAEGLVDAVDGFCEGIAFSTTQMARLFSEAKRLGLPVKLHAEQLSNRGGAKLAASFGALSCEHLEYVDDEGIAAMAAAGCVAVLLPGAFYTLREKQMPPVDGFRQAGVPIAVSTDLNPGSSPLGSLLLAMNMACTLFRMTPEEALAGTTRHAARALGCDDRGRIAAGLKADLAVWNCAEPAELSYRFGVNPLHARIIGGCL